MSENACIFCNIANGKIPSKKVAETDLLYAFYDINPLAKTHFLIIPKLHTANINELARLKSDIFSDIFKFIEFITTTNGLEKNGFRVVSNLGSSAGQTVFHTHFHILSDDHLGNFGKNS